MGYNGINSRSHLLDSRVVASVCLLRLERFLSSRSTGLYFQQCDHVPAHTIPARPEEMQGDREVCKASVGQNGMALERASEEMKGHSEVCKATVNTREAAAPHSPQWRTLKCRRLLHHVVRHVC